MFHHGDATIKWSGFPEAVRRAASHFGPEVGLGAMSLEEEEGVDRSAAL
jgi:hypothetical protein